MFLSNFILILGKKTVLEAGHTILSPFKIIRCKHISLGWNTILNQIPQSNVNFSKHTNKNRVQPTSHSIHFNHSNRDFHICSTVCLFVCCWQLWRTFLFWAIGRKLSAKTFVIRFVVCCVVVLVYSLCLISFSFFLFFFGFEHSNILYISNFIVTIYHSNVDWHACRQAFSTACMYLYTHKVGTAAYADFALFRMSHTYLHIV